MPAIVTQRLEREFEGGLRAVDGVDLEVAEGEIYGFLGPNGAGKTTTVRMLTTLLQPTGGHASVAGHDVVSEAKEVRKSIGVALQEAALDPLMTGRELIRLQATLHGMPPAEGRRQAEVLLERVGLVQAADRRVGTYSGGMRRRLAPAPARVHGGPAPPGRGAGPGAAAALPRGADIGPRPGDPQGDLGGGVATQRGGDDGLP